jgi:5-methylcytosine-specific restriction endonuclease McrA
LTFPESVKQEAKLRGRGVCECTRNTCQHYGPCKARGSEFHHKKLVSAGGSEELTNCQFLCKPCHEQAHSGGYGVGLL